MQAGDHDFDGSPVLAQTLTADSIYIKTQPLHWIPEYFGGGSGNPVPLLTDFEVQVERLRLTNEQYAASAQLRRWCVHNRSRCYVPEWLLEECGMTVEWIFA